MCPTLREMTVLVCRAMAEDDVVPQLGTDKPERTQAEFYADSTLFIQSDCDKIAPRPHIRKESSQFRLQ